MSVELETLEGFPGGDLEDSTDNIRYGLYLNACKDRGEAVYVGGGVSRLCDVVKGTQWSRFMVVSTAIFL